jgi:hypothetical protein
MSRYHLRRFLLLLALAVAWSCLFQEWFAMTRTSTPTRHLHLFLSTHTHTNDKKTQDLHSSHVARLPLAAWELESLRGLHRADNATMLKKDRKQVARDSCHPPSGIPPQCCLGTFAGMGRIIQNRRHLCAHAATALENLMTTTSSSSSASASASASTNEACDVCALVEHLRHTNQSMAFVGDSMSHQIFQGFVCEFYRRRYTVLESTVRLAMPRGRHAKGGINHCLHIVRTVQVSSPTWEQDTVVTFKFFHIYRLPFAHPQQERMVLESAPILVVNFGLHWGAHYKYHGRRTNTSTSIDTNGHTMMDDHHHHHHHRSNGLMTGPDNPPTPQHLETVLTQWLQKAKAQQVAPGSPLQKIMMRETSAQHFDAEGGDYSFVKPRFKRHATTNNDTAVRKRNNGLQQQQCVPFRHDDGRTNGTSTSSSGWRERAIRNAARRANYSIRELPSEGATATAIPNEPPLNPVSTPTSGRPTPMVTILPFSEWTRPLHGLHPYNSKDDDNDDDGEETGGDCTHYCSSPFLYLPLWRSIREGIQQ